MAVSGAGFRNGGANGWGALRWGGQLVRWSQWGLSSSDLMGLHACSLPNMGCIQKRIRIVQNDMIMISIRQWAPEEEYDPAKPNDYDEFCRRRHPQASWFHVKSKYQNDPPWYPSWSNVHVRNSLFNYSIQNAQDETKSRRGDGKETSGDQWVVDFCFCCLISRFCASSRICTESVGLHFLGRMLLLVSNKQVSQLHHKRQCSRYSFTAVTLGL